MPTKPAIAAQQAKSECWDNRQHMHAQAPSRHHHNMQEVTLVLSGILKPNNQQTTNVHSQHANMRAFQQDGYSSVQIGLMLPTEKI